MLLMHAVHLATNDVERVGFTKHFLPFVGF